MKKLAVYTLFFLILVTPFVIQHEWLHQDVAEAYGCQSSEIQIPSIENLDEYGFKNLPAAYVTWYCENAEDQEQVKQLQLIVEIVGYQTLLIFVSLTVMWIFQVHEFKQFAKSLNRIERSQAVIIEELGIESEQLQGENQQS